MKTIAVKDSIVVLNPAGPWVWESGPTIEVKIPRGDGFAITGLPALLKNNLIEAIKEQVTRSRYLHVPAALKSGGIASVEVTVDESSLSSWVFFRDEPVVTSHTSGTFTIFAADPSQVSAQDVDVKMVHSGSWRIEDANQAICLETNDGLSPRFVEVDLGAPLARSPAGGTGDKDTDDEVQRFHFWIKAFIPKVHSDPSLKHYFFKTDKGTWALEAPDIPTSLATSGAVTGPLLAKTLSEISKLNGTCFETDNRTESDDPEASARLTSEFVLVIKGEDVSIEKAGGREMARVGQTRNIHCKSGKELQRPRTADSKSIYIGDVEKDGDQRVVKTSASGGDPFYAILGLPVAPKVDYEAELRYDTKTRKLHINFTTGVFPAFEAYYRLNDGPAKKLLEVDIKGRAWRMFDLWTGLNTKSHKPDEIAL